MATSSVDFAYFFDYLVLARGKLLGWIRGQPAEVYTRTFPIGLGSIRYTLQHIASAEFGYSLRLRGIHEGPGDYPFDEPMPALEAFLAAWERQRPVTRDALAAVTDPSRPVEYVFRQTRVRTVAGGIAGQLLFHEAHHRAQVMAMLRQAGVKAENLDYSILMMERTPLG
jgi:uncharacterized damage-inducible protein DinB